MQRQWFLLVKALSEGATGIALLATPAIVLSLLLGVSQPHAETLITARIAGAALVAIAISCWLARYDPRNPSQNGLLCGLLFYDAATAILLAFASIRWSLAGVGLWPAVALHSSMGVWCLACLTIHSQLTAPKNY